MTIITEHKGLAAVYNICNGMDAVWRPTTTADLGIDGQIEFLEKDKCVSTGNIVAVQVKSGESYFENKETDTEVKYYPKEMHRRYWKSLNLPVILVLHHPNRKETYFADVKPQIAVNGPIILKKKDVLLPEARSKLISICREENYRSDPITILGHFEKIQLRQPGGGIITGVEFLAAFTNIQERYFHVRFIRLYTLLKMLNSTGSIGLGNDEFEFLHRCSMAMSSFRLADPFHEEFYEWWYEIKMVPDLYVPLKHSGVEVLAYLAENSFYFKDSFYNKLPYPIQPDDLFESISKAAQEAVNKEDASERMHEHSIS